ncbi:hypothetical protein KAF25_006963 [Fusarium avenaceum]|uniref:Uncharacterized protein n=1 Tax=Fusarium avenaceum TaxID=40199 RepID=A0A9P7H3W0_9HYPO|nr:hypothetical protein KAF25_006963 [Fusarium avenaceum]
MAEAVLRAAKAALEAHAAAQDRTYAAHDTSGSREPINWAVDPDRRVKQIRGVFLELFEPEAGRYLKDAEQKQKEIEQLDTVLQEKIQSYSKIAYGSLETMVQALLLIDNGEKSYKSQHIDIVGALDDCTDKFSQLSTACGHSVRSLGEKAGDCMELKDRIGRFIYELRSEMDQVNGPVQSIMERKRERDENYERQRQRGEVLDQQLRDLRSSSNDFGYQFSSIFSNDAENNLRDRVNDAQRRLAINEKEKAMELDKSQQFYQLAMTSLNGGAAIATLIDQVQQTHDKMGFEYSHVTNHHQAADGLFRGLLDLKNQLYAGDWTSTRDRSLQVVLQLMQKDDEVFQRQAYYEDIEVRVKAAIVSKLGEGAVARLLAPAAPAGYVEY